MKQSRLLEIIREEISAVLHEGEAEDKAAKAAELKAIDAKQKALDAERKDTMKGGALEEETLNEMAFALKKGLTPSEKLEPRYKKENFKKVVDLILSKVDGKKTMADVARELGVIQQKIRPVVSDLIDTGILEKGEAESKSGKDSINKPDPKAKAEKPSISTPSTTTMSEPEDDEDAEAAKSAGSDETAKKLGNISTRKDKIVKAYQELQPQVKDKITQAKAGDKESTNWLKDKWTPILKAYNKAKEVKI
jgi:hypothetical protein